MNKIVCNICGTSYPENASQCPICGYSRSADTDMSGVKTENTYTYVKGGRYSKSNVKKRNKGSQQVIEKPESTAGKKQKDDNNGKGLAVVVVILLLAIAAVVGYIALRFFIPNDFIFEGLDNLSFSSIFQKDEPVSDPVEEPSDDLEVPEETSPAYCTGISLNETNLEFDTVGATYTLVAAVQPVDTVDVVSFSSDDEAVVTVDASGVLTITGEGEAIITAVCGEYSAQCAVSCILVTEPEVEELVLNRKEITFNDEEQSWLLYDGTIPLDEIIWSSDDNSIATIDNGKVVAVGNGDTTVYGAYGDQTVSCMIHCDFNADSSGSTGNISEASGDSKRTYKLYNPNGYADDVTLKVDESFTLKLVDENKKAVEDAQWKVDNEKICSYKDSIVKALKKGTTEITATYEGKTYTCIVRVN